MLDIKLIAAFDHHMTIGSGGSMPWHLPNDLNFFKETTWAHPIIFGRKTYESIGKPLPGRTNIVMTRQSNLDTAGIEIAHSVEEATGIASSRDEEVYIAGGAEIYEAFLPQADEMILTIIHDTFEGNRFFPDFAISEWNPIRINTHERDDRHPHRFTWWKLQSSTEQPHWCSPNSSYSQCPKILRNSQ